MESTIRRKYDEITVLIGTTYIREPSAEGTEELRYWLTTKPAFEMIDTETFGAINTTEYIRQGDGSHVIGKIVLDTCFVTPITHNAFIPTFREIMNQIPDEIPCYPQCPMKYIYISPLPYLIAGMHFSRLLCAVQTGSIVSGERYVVRIDPKGPYGQMRTPVNFPRIPLAREEMARRMAMMMGAAVTYRPPPEEGHLTIERTQLIAGQELEVAGQKVSVGASGNLIVRDSPGGAGTIFAWFVMYIPTFHHYVYQGLFKPSLEEAVEQMPAHLFRANTESRSERHWIIATEVVSLKPWEAIIGDHHVAFTTVWEYNTKSLSLGLLAPNAAAATSAATTAAGAEPVPMTVVAAATAMTTSVTAAAPPLRDDYNEDKCMICLDATPNTMVLPCGHIVVCKPCSFKLASSHDAQICVKCRRAIDEVIYP